MLQLGAPDDIYERPNCRFVADFIGEANVLPGGLVGLDAPFAAIRPERVMIGFGPDGEADSRPQAGLPGRVTDVTYLGATTSCVVALESGSTVKVERSDLPKGIRPGQTVRCLFPADALLALGG